MKSCWPFSLFVWFLFLLLDFFRLLYKSLQKELRKHFSKDNEKSSWSQKTKQMQAFAVLFIDHRYAKALLAVALLKNPALLKHTAR